MTAALDAMVRAMVANIRAQDCRLVLDADGVTLDSGYDGAQFDVEKVARAGLEALADQPFFANAGYDPDPQLGLSDYERGTNDTRATVRSILEQKP